MTGEHTSLSETTGVVHLSVAENFMGTHCMQNSKTQAAGHENFNIYLRAGEYPELHHVSTTKQRHGNSLQQDATHRPNKIVCEDMTSLNDGV